MSQPLSPLPTPLGAHRPLEVRAVEQPDGARATAVRMRGR